MKLDFNLKARPNASFMDTVIDGSTVQFIANDNSMNHYSWSFGDQDSGTGYHPVHKYAGTGSFIATLITTSANGCTGTSKIALNITTGIENDLAESLKLSMFPNPFSTSVSISYTLPKAMHVQTEVYDLAGRHIATLSNESQPTGRHSALFDPAQYDAPEAAYIIKLQLGNTIIQRLVVFTK